MTDSRQKGKRNELAVVNFWESIFPDAARHLEYQNNEADKGIDVWLNVDRTKGVQVKAGKQVPKKVYKFLDQIDDDVEFKFVQAKRDYKDWVVLMGAEEFFKLLKKVENQSD